MQRFSGSWMLPEKLLHDFVLKFVWQRRKRRRWSDRHWSELNFEGDKSFMSKEDSPGPTMTVQFPSIPCSLLEIRSENSNTCCSLLKREFSQNRNLLDIGNQSHSLHDSSLLRDRSTWTSAKFRGSTATTRLEDEYFFRWSFRASQFWLEFNPNGQIFMLLVICSSTTNRPFY